MPSGSPSARRRLERNPGLRVLALDLAQAREFAPLPGIRDPFNRLMVAAARAVRCLLVTADEALAASGPVDALCD